MLRKWVVLCLFLWGTVTLLGGCAHTPEGGRLAEDIRDSAEKYWNYRMTGDFDKAFYYERISLKPDIHPKNQYIGNAATNAQRLKLQGFKILGIEERDNVAFVELELRFTANVGAINIKTPLTNTIKDKWEKIDGKWYHVIQQITGVEF